MSDIKIFSFDKCPFAQRTRMALIEKGLDFELIEIDVYNKPDWFLEISPYGKVPVLVHKGKTIYESAIINEYLEEEYPEVALMPEDHYERARARIWIDYASNYYLPACSRLLRDHHDDDLQQQNLKIVGDRLLYIEKECFDKNHSGVFWMGEQLTLVDLHYAPFFERFGAYEHLFDAKWPKECRKIRSWWDAMQDRQSYLETFLPTESHIATYSNMMQRLAS
tara:strand:- start:162 stop:827 length:666 start_codon:yes stop_codon:yes gene_type:complete